MSIERFHVGARLSEASVHQNVVYLAGQIASDTQADIIGQTREVLASIDRLLAETNSDKSRLLFVQIFIADMSEFAHMNQVWDEWVAGIQAPPRATVQALLADSRCKVEIVVTAARRD
ncbi:MAG: RidA family protein [Janthinobacterium lividum]